MIVKVFILIAIIFFHIAAAWGSEPDPGVDKIKEARAETERNPDSATAYYNLGTAFFTAKKYEEAREAFFRAVDINPDYAEPYYGLGAIYLLRDNGFEFLKNYTILKRLNPVMADKLFSQLGKKEVAPFPPPGVPVKTSPSDTEKKEIVPADKTATAQTEVTPAGAGMKEHYDPKKEIIPPGEFKTEVLHPVMDRTESSSAESLSHENPPPIEKKMYSVQLGVFESENNAVSLTEKLRRKGYDVFIQKETRPGKKTRYRVFTGKFDDRKQASAQSDALFQKEGIESIIVKYSNDGHI
ncbi:MAG: SPOR domain-containing protein [Nitrospirota bacterium]